MGSRKRSARAKQVEEFKSSLGGSGLGYGGMDDVFAREDQRKKRASEEKEAAQRKKACESKNRYSCRSDAEEAIASCAAYGTKGLKCYRCPHCNGWHLTSHPWE